MKEVFKTLVVKANNYPKTKTLIRVGIRILPAFWRFKVRGAVEKYWSDVICYSKRGFYYPNKSEIGIGADVFGFDESHIPLLIKTYAPDPRVIIDIGANIGIETLQMAEVVSNDCLIIAFEPADLFEVVLRKNVAHLKNVEVHKKFVSSKSNETALLHINATSASPVYGASKSFPTLRTQETPTISLDDFIGARRIDRLDFLKTDTDGNDYAVIAGATATIRRFKPALFIEFSGYHLEKMGSSNGDLIDLIDSLGYRDFIVFQGHHDPAPMEAHGKAELASLLKRDSTANVFAYHATAK